MTTTLTPTELATARRLWHRYQDAARADLASRRYPVNPGTRFAADHWDRATTEARFATAEDAGLVRIRVEPDETASLDYLLGDMFNPAVCGLPAARLERERREEVERINRDGVWAVIGEYFDGEDWQLADSCSGFVGEDWRGSGYDTDIMAATLDAAAAVQTCPCCGRPNRGRK